MVFIAKNIPRYRQEILNKTKISVYTYSKKYYKSQSWLINDNDGITFFEALKKPFFIVSDYNLVSLFFIFLSKFLFKKIYIASDWNPIQKVSFFSQKRKLFMEYFSDGFIKGSPLSYPYSKKTKIIGMLYMTSILSFKQNISNKKSIDFVYVGQLINRKNISYIITVFNILTEQGYRCKIFGLNGFELKEIKNKISSAKFEIKNSITWSKTQEILARSKCMFYPSREDVWGLTIGEALNNCCLPVFSKNIISGEYYSNKIPELKKYICSMNLSEDIEICKNALSTNFLKIKKLSDKFIELENELIRESIKSLNDL